ncbi:SPOR domain-containing protein [Thermodesulfobacteriota bacterium]
MAQYDINIREYWRILKKRKLIVIITAILLGGFSTIVAYLQAPTSLYTSTCSIKFEKETTMEGLYARSLSWSGSSDIETQLAIITGYSVLIEVAKNMALIPRWSTNEENRLKPNVIRVTENLKSKVKVDRESFTNILNIKVTDPDRVFAQRMANELANTYQRLHAEQQGKRTLDAIKYIDTQLKNVSQKLKMAEEEFNRFSQANQLISVDMQSDNLLLRKKEISDTIRKLNEDNSELEALSVRVDNFRKDPSSTDNNFYSIKATLQYENTNNSLVELLLKRETLLENYTSQHPEVRTIGLKINENVRKMILLLNLQVDNIEKRKIDLDKEMEEVNRKTNLLMGKKLEFDRLKREVDSFRSMTALLEKKNQEALIRKAEKPEEVVIVKPALLPSTPINPPKTVATGAMGIFIGIVLGLVLAFIIETFDTSLGAIEDVEETLGAKVLGVIPETDAKDIMASLKDKDPKELEKSSFDSLINLVSHFAPKTMIAESFRALRTNIQFRDGDDKVKTIAITSTSPQEGKTLVSINLAISLAQAGLKTLLVGADLRKPTLAKAFGLENSPGLTDIVMGNYHWNDTVKTITDIIMGKMTMDEVMMTPGLDNLHIITSGPIPPNPAELIQSNRLMAFIKEAENEYDIVIFDSTPVLSTADAAILGTKVDGMFIVYRVGSVSRGLLKRTATSLEQVKCNIIGVILNGMKPDLSPDFQDYKAYQYYAYYGEEGKDGKHQGRARSFPFFWRKGDGRDSLIESALPSSSGMALSDRQKRKTSFPLRAFLIILALMFLAAGMLWQNGIIDPAKFLNLVAPVKSMDVKPPVAKKSLSSTEERVSEALVAKPESMEGNASIKKTEANKETPVSQPDIVTVNRADREMMKSVYQPELFPFSLYLGSFSTKERAKKAITQHDQKGFSPYWVKIKFKNKGTWYRIYAGHFKDQEQAQRVIQEHGLTDAKIRKTAYANLVGIYKISGELETMIQTLKDLGYSPYIVKNQDRESVLFLGAFTIKARAEDQNMELRSGGIRSHVVKR